MSAPHDEADEPRSAEHTLRSVVYRDRARLIGALARWCGDLQLAEDAFSDAVERALTAWQESVPTDPAAWLVTVARNRIRDVLRSAERQRTNALDEDHALPSAPASTRRTDDTLRLMLACAHPALDRSVHAPLMLQTVLGVATADIAQAFALPQSTLAKRLVRAKQKLRINRASFEIPDTVDEARITAVLDAIYAAYAIDWLRIGDADAADRVTDEAVHASQLLLAALPRQNEVRGLAALLVFLHARREARMQDGMLLPIEEQDTSLWDPVLIRQAESLLAQRFLRGDDTLPGPYELQAAIQSVHCARQKTGMTDWSAAARLYDALVSVTPSRGAAVARAVAIARATDDPTVGLAHLDWLIGQDESLASFQPYHAARSALLVDSDRAAESVPSFRVAIDLCTHPPSRRYLEARLSALTVVDSSVRPGMNPPHTRP